MRYLFIDASNNDTYAQIGDNERWQGKFFDTNRNLGALITDIFAEMLQLGNISKNDIDIFVCATGPGSLTGLRVAAAFMRTCAYVTRKPVIGIDLFTWAHKTLLNQRVYGDIRLVIPTLIDKAFEVKTDMNPSFVPAPKLIERKFATDCPVYGIRYESESVTRLEPDGEALHQLIIERGANAGTEFKDILDTLPLYIIKSQAERKLEEKSC